MRLAEKLDWKGLMASLLMRDTYFFNVAKLSNLCCITVHNLFSIYFSVTLVDILKPGCAISLQC